MMKNNLCKLFVGALLLLLPTLGLAQEEVNPYTLVQGVANKTFERIKAEQEQIKQEPDTLRAIVEDELLPYMDYKFAALKVLGKHYKKAPKKQLQEYLHVFRDYLIASYAVVLSYYNGQEVVFEPGRAVGKSKTVTVRALVKDDTRPDIKMAFKVRKNSKTKQWKAYDMVAEGISVLSSKQSEFDGILRQQGIGAVIDIMKAKVAEPVQLKSNTQANQ